MTPLRLLTCTGVLLSVVVPSPNWPYLLLPHAQTVPSDFRARLRSPPQATAMTPLRPLTCTGALLSVVVPSPNWPYLLFPHAQAVPSDFRARLCKYPQATAMTPLRLLTCTGVLLSVVVPSPNWPYSLLPHAQTVPSDFTARLCCKYPQATAMTPLRLLTCTGVLLSVVVPSPNWPYSLLPHAQTVPSDFTARLRSHPQATSMERRR